MVCFYHFNLLFYSTSTFTAAQPYLLQSVFATYYRVKLPMVLKDATNTSMHKKPLLMTEQRLERKVKDDMLKADIRNTQEGLFGVVSEMAIKHEKLVIIK